MATPPKRAAAHAADAPAPVPATIETAYSRVQAILEQLGQGAADASVRLFRMTAGRPAYLDPMTLSANLYDEVKELYGGGEYRADVVNGNGKLVTHFAFSIFGPPKLTAAAPVAPAPQLPATPAQPTNVELLLLRVVERLERLESPATPARDPVAEFTRMAEVFRSMQSDTKRESLLDVAKAVFDFQDQVAARLNGPPEAKEDTLVTIAREIGKPALALLSRAQDSQQGRPPDVVNPTAAAAPAAATPAATPAPPEQRPPLRLVDQVPVDADPITKLMADIPLPARAALRGMAASNTDPNSACNVALSMLDDEQVARIAEQVARPDFLDVMLASVPTFRPYAAWFGEFVAGIRASLSDDDRETGSAGDDAPPNDSHQVAGA